MCGNSICQDRRFLAREMPALEKFFHYRNLDVSTVKELARRWAPDVLAGCAEVLDPSRLMTCASRSRSWLIIGGCFSGLRLRGLH